MPDDIGPGHLLLIAAMSPRTEVERALRAYVRPEDLRTVGGTSSLEMALYIAYADATPADVRDWLADGLGDGAVAFVVEFERWSALGDAADRAWLLRRGH